MAGAIHILQKVVDSTLMWTPVLDTHFPYIDDNSKRKPNWNARRCWCLRSYNSKSSLCWLMSQRDCLKVAWSWTEGQGE